MVKRKEVRLVPIKSVDQTADYLTKILTIEQFHKCREQSGMFGNGPELTSL
jgi:hypothetical protein